MGMDGKHLRARDDANISFDRENFEKALDEREAQRPAPPQPTLTPNGPLRDQVDARVREKQEAINAKMRADRAVSRER